MNEKYLDGSYRCQNVTGANCRSRRLVGWTDSVGPNCCMVGLWVDGSSRHHTGVNTENIHEITDIMVSLRVLVPYYQYCRRKLLNSPSLSPFGLQIVQCKVLNGLYLYGCNHDDVYKLFHNLTISRSFSNCVAGTLRIVR